MESFENLPDPDAAWQSGPQGPDRHLVSVMMVWVLVYGSYIKVPNLGALRLLVSSCGDVSPCRLAKNFYSSPLSIRTQIWQNLLPCPTTNNAKEEYLIFFDVQSVRWRLYAWEGCCTQLTIVDIDILTTLTSPAEKIHKNKTLTLREIAAKSIFEHLFMNPHCARRVSSNALFDLFRCQILQLMANDCRKKTIRSYTGSPSDFQQQVGWETRLIRSWLQTTPRFWSSLVCWQEPKRTVVNIGAPPFPFLATVKTLTAFL